MPYPTTDDVSSIINRVRTWFLRDQEFNSRQITMAIFLEFINEALDEIYQTCYPRFEEWSVNTVVGTWSYAMDGTTGNFPNEIGEIFRVDYDGSPLDRKLFLEQVIPCSSSTDVGKPEYWYERTDNGIRYLELDVPPDSVVALKIYGTRQPSVVSASADKLPLERDFWKLVKDMVIARIYEWLDKPDKADRWLEVYVGPGKRRLARLRHERLGRKISQRMVGSAEDWFE